MRIQIKLSALRQMRWHEFLTRFLLGGGITVVAGLVAKHLGPVIGGLLLAFPAIFPAAATLIEKHQRQKQSRAGFPNTVRGKLAAALDARGAAMGAIALSAFALIIWRFLPLYPAAVIMPAALLAWLLLAISLWRARKAIARVSRRSRRM